MRNVLGSFLTLAIGLMLSVGALSNFVYGESITVTTYYPSPYGMYKNLKTKRLVVGNSPMPGTDGVVNFQGLANNPSFSEDGALYYNETKHEFRYYDGGTNTWKRMGGFGDFLIVQSSKNLGGGSGGAFAYCPSGYIRIACSGGLDFNSGSQSFWDSGDESSKGYNGSAPVENGGLQGCTAFADGGANVYVWAYCVK